MKKTRTRLRTVLLPCSKTTTCWRGAKHRKDYKAETVLGKKTTGNNNKNKKEEEEGEFTVDWISLDWTAWNVCARTDACIKLS